MLTTEQLQAIRERAEKATQGPWTAVKGQANDDRIESWGSVCAPEEVEGGSWLLRIEEDGNAPKEDASFIAHARQDIPNLLAEIDRLHALLAPLKGESAEIIMRELRRRQSGNVL